MNYHLLYILLVFDWQMLSIPVIAAFVGWITNLLAIRMTFYPVEFLGRRPFGWQGIIPANAAKMANKAVTLLTRKLLDIRRQFALLNAEEVTKALGSDLESLSESIINEAMQMEFPLIWKWLPEQQKRRIYKDVEDRFPAAIASILADVKSGLEKLLDVRKMVVDALTADKAMLNRVFLKCGEKEFIFIERSGIYFGFLFGIAQMFIWNLAHSWWILPLGGLIVGYATNWLALKLIFRPVHPIKLGPLVIQGLFMKRQQEVSEEYAKIIAAEILPFEKMFSFVLNNRGGDALTELAQHHIEDLVDETVGTAGRTIIKLKSGSKGYERLRQMAVRKFSDALPGSIRHMFKYADEALDIRPTIERSMRSLTKEEFEDVLRPVFREEETTLILIGAALGLVAGFLQLLVLGT